jgi:hypothetical protein
MFPRLAADAILLIHALFVLFVLFGAALGAWWRWIPVVHLPAAAWGVFVELTGRVCPLTPLENSLRLRAGQSGYSDSFIEHYILDLMYPPGLTDQVQLTLAGIVVAVNVVIYAWLIRRWRRGAPLHKRNPEPT